MLQGLWANSSGSISFIGTYVGWLSFKRQCLPSQLFLRLLVQAEIVYHSMPHCYALSPIHYDCPNRDGFLIHGGNCADNPTDGCVVIEDPATRQLIKGGGLLNVEK
jgi:hypothetical protein